MYVKGGGRTYCEECGPLTFAAMRQTAGFAVCMHTFVAMEPKSRIGMC